MVRSQDPAARAGNERLTDGRSNMDNNPFAQSANAPDPLNVRRRSTRVDYITTVLLSGKDAGGAPFREFTQTSIVNMHGCKLRTSYRIMVGMLVSLECPKAGMAGKGVCVRVWDSPPGVSGSEIAIQLIKPQNMWGVPDPPPDWEIVAKSMVQGRVAHAERPARGVAPPPPPVPPRVAPPRPPLFPSTVTPAPAPPKPPVAVAPPPMPPVAMAPVVAAPPPAPPVVVAPAVVLPPAVAPMRPAPVAGPTIEQRLAEIERRATQLMDSVLDIMRGQAEEIARSALEEFRQQAEAVIQDSEGRLRQGLQQTYEESAASLISLRSDLMEKMVSRGAQMVRTSEETLRTRLRSKLPMDETQLLIKPPVTEPEK